MLFDLSMTELMLIGVVALVVIGPKDLPKALRVAGYWVRKARTLSREFHSSFEQMIREAELDEMRRELNKVTEIDIEHEFRRTIDPTGSLAESLKPPELPKLHEAETPAAASGAPSPSPTEPAEVEPNLPPPEISQTEGEKAVAPVEAGAQGDQQSPASPGPALARE